MGINRGPLLAALLSISSAAFLASCGSAKQPLTSEEQQAWDNFIGKQLSQTMQRPTSQDANAVAAIGDKIVPYIEESLGKGAAASIHNAGPSDHWLVIVLARIGTPRAVEGISKVLRHEYPGRLGIDRETAAKAVEWLGAKEAIPALEYAIQDHIEEIIEQTGSPPDENNLLDEYGQEVKRLRQRLENLKAGKGVRATTNFPYDRKADSEG